MPAPLSAFFSAGPRRGRAAALGLVLFLVVLGVFLPAVKNQFINFDDPEYVTANDQVQRGLTWGGIRWALRTTHAGNWHPLTWLSHMADCQVYGLHPWGHHLTNVLLHALNALLLFLVLRRMTGATWRSLLVAALFGLHPLRVESVAWVAERKDVLSTCFWMLTMWAYARWAGECDARNPRAGIFYGLALCCLALGLMSKAMLVSVPFVLLLLDYWPLNRLREPAGPFRLRILARRVVEKIPFAALAAADCVATFVAQKNRGAVADVIGMPFCLRVENALISICAYLGKLLYPAKLAVFYPYPDSFPVAQIAGACVLLAGISGAAVALRRTHPYVFFGWLWFLGTLVPVIGLVQVGNQSMADRYTYVPSIGLLVLAVWGAGEVAARWRRGAAVAVAVSAAFLAGFAFLTLRQIGTWEDDETLFQHAVNVTEDNWLAHTNLGNALLKHPDRQAQAIAEFQETLRLEPGMALASYSLGVALEKAGRLSEAIGYYEQALRLKPDYAEAHNDFGNALREAGSIPAAIAQYEEALRLTPDVSGIQCNLGIALSDAGRLPEAIAHFEEAVRLDPTSSEALSRLANASYNLGIAMARAGRMDDAIAAFEHALRLRPGFAKAHNNLGAIYAGMGRMPEAIAHYEESLRLTPNDAAAQTNLGVALADAGRMPEAIVHYDQALRLDPLRPEIHNDYGNALVAAGEIPKAVAQYEEALRLRPDYVDAHVNLGAALAQVGRTAEARAEFEKALELKPDDADARASLARLQSLQ